MVYANIDFDFQGTEFHSALSVGHSRTSPVQSYKSTRTSIRQVAKALAGKHLGDAEHFILSLMWFIDNLDFSQFFLDY